MESIKRFIFILLLLISFAGVSAQNITLVDLTPTPVTCGGEAEGSIFIEVTGGIGNISYTLFNGGVIVSSTGLIPSRTHTFVGFPKGSDYLIYVADANLGTTNLITPASIGGPDPITISSTVTTDINCATFNDGSITVIASGEDDNLIYNLIGPFSTSNNDGIFNLLPTGNYDVIVSHATCPSTADTTNLFIDIPPLLTATLDNITPATCYEGSDGSIEISPGGGTPSGIGTGYTYSWTGPDGYTSTSEDISGLEAGEYTVTVTDNNGCTALLGPLTVGQASEITVPIVNSTDVTCNGGNDGTASISVAGGSGPYSFAWLGQVSGFSSTAQNPADLVADTYDLTITDAVSCPKVFTGLVTIGQPDPISIIVDGTSDVSCFGGSDGSASVTINGGTAPYTFSWTAVGPYTSIQEDPSAMPADTYSLRVTDSRGCFQDFPAVLTIGQPEEITAVLNGFSDVSCFGGNDGSALVTVDKGTPGYTFLWTGDATAHSSTAEDPADLIKDTYDLRVTDANSCVKIFNNIVTIDQPADITSTISITPVDCNGGTTGSIDIGPSGGTSPYNFAWTGPNGFSSTNEDISGLEDGSYDLTITDAQACVKDFLNNVVIENTSITASFSITNLSCNSAGDGEIAVVIGGGVAPYTVSWSGDNGYSNTIDEDISLLDAANYTLTVTDALGCVQAFPAQLVTEPAPLAASFVGTNSTCYQSDDGTINVTASGGTAPYSFSWTGPAPFSSTLEDISGLAPGAYSLDLSDANGCLVNYPNEVTLTEPSDINVVPTATNISCNGADDGTVSIVASGGTPGYTFGWTGPNGFSSTNQNLSALEPGTYNLTVTDNNTCIKPFPGLASLTEPPAIVVTFSGQTDLACFGDNDGSIDIDIAGGSPPYAFSWTNSLGAVVSTSEDPTGLSAGTYSLEVTDAGPCTVSFPDAVTLTEPDPLSTTLNQTDVLCAGENNGTITVIPAGGTAPYTHSRFLAGPYGPGTIFSGLSSGTYRIYTKDANGCTTNSTTVIDEPEAINYAYSVSGTNQCNGDSSVTISINSIIGGVAPYEYSINGGGSYQTNSVFPNIPGGTYPVVVRDANLCEQAILPLTVLEPDSISIVYYDQGNISTCFDDPAGYISIDADGGTGNMSYSLNSGPAEPIGDFTSLFGGSYIITIIDEHACRKDTTVEILRPAQIIFDKADISDVTGCPGDNNGEIDANALGGTGIIQYSLDSGPLQAGGLFSSLLAGDYIVTARDANGCPSDTMLSVGEPLAISIIEETASPASCNGTSTGQVTVTASGGTPPYTYTLDPPLLPANSSGIFSGLPQGDYTVDVTDSEACGPVSTGTLTITEPAALLLDSTFVRNISCNGANDGKIEIFVVGGTSPYEYSIDNEASYSSTSSFTGIGPGTYDVYARDANGCPIFIDTYTLIEPPNLSLTALVSDVSPCFAGSNGEISATASGGWNSYEYSIDGLTFQPTGDFINLTAGEYTVFTRDTGNCTASVDVTVDEPAEITATVDKTDYVDAVLGTITISNESGGTPPYEYSIDGLGGTFSSTTSYSDLVAGSYDVVVRDANGCTFELPIQIYDIIPLNMVINPRDVSCFGLEDGSIEFQPQDAVGTVQYSIDDGGTYHSNPLFENLPGDSTYLLRAYDDDGKQYYGSIFIAEPPQLFIYKSITPANCNENSPTGSVDLTIAGGTGISSVLWSNGLTTEDLNNVVSGWYYVEVTDEAACVEDDSIYIPSLVNVTANAGQDTTVCAGSTIVLDALAGAVMLWEPATYLSNQGISNPVAANIIDSISYTYTVTETSSGYGCYATDTLQINVLPVYGIEIPSDTFGLEGQVIQIEALTSGNFDAYEWIPTTGLDMSDVPDPVITLQSSISYVLEATNDFGCIESDTIFVEVVEDITVYNAFSPNGDFINDFFEIENAEKFPDILVEVFNRWGSKVFSSTGYTYDLWWDGTFNGKDVPIGTYYYVIIPYPDATPITGNVTIIR